MAVNPKGYYLTYYANTRSSSNQIYLNVKDDKNCANIVVIS